MYPLVCISFSRYSRIFSLSNPYPRSNAARVSLSRPCVLPSLSPLIVFLGSCLLPFPPSLAIHPHLPPSSAFLFRSTLSPPLRSVPMPTPPLSSSVQRRAHVFCYSYFFPVRMCACGWESGRAQPPTPRGRFSGPCDMCTHARARAILPSFEPRETVYRSCAVQRELRKGGGGVLRVNSIPRVALQVPFDTQAWLVLPFLSWNICIF